MRKDSKDKDSVREGCEDRRSVRNEAVRIESNEDKKNGNLRPFPLSLSATHKPTCNPLSPTLPAIHLLYYRDISRTTYRKFITHRHPQTHLSHLHSRKYHPLSPVLTCHPSFHVHVIKTPQAAATYYSSTVTRLSLIFTCASLSSTLFCSGLIW